jgi:hypothetical protein
MSSYPWLCCPKTGTHHGLCLRTHRGAGTDANVFIELYGDKGVIGQTRLDTEANNFERNKTDVFSVRVFKATGGNRLSPPMLYHLALKNQE